jgi:hypothetical protein
LNGFVIAHWLAGTAISAVIANIERSIPFHFDSGNGAGLNAVGNFLALFMINFVHTTSFYAELSAFRPFKSPLA